MLDNERIRLHLTTLKSTIHTHFPNLFILYLHMNLNNMWITLNGCCNWDTVNFNAWKILIVLRQMVDAIHDDDENILRSLYHHSVPNVSCMQTESCCVWLWFGAVQFYPYPSDYFTWARPLETTLTSMGTHMTWITSKLYMDTTKQITSKWYPYFVRQYTVCMKKPYYWLSVGSIL